MTQAVSRRPLIAAVGSAFIPGVGQALTGPPASGMAVFATAVALLTGCWFLEQTAGIGAGICAFLLLVLPWWSLQTYEAWLSGVERTPVGLTGAARRAWQRAHDLRFLGILFLITAATDFYIIVVNPTYALTIFCTKPEGLFGILAKAQSPTLHVLIGYGFLRLRRWSYLLYVAYALFGLVNAAVNSACFGYGRVRTVFVISLVAFTAYVVARRRRFQS